MESLYSVLRHPWQMRDYLRGVWQNDRKNAYEDEALNIMELEEKKKGAALVMENDSKRVVGCASLIINDAFARVKSAGFDLFVMPEYFAEMSTLLEGLEQRAGELEVERLEIWVCPGDRAKLEAINSAGFEKTGAKMDAKIGQNNNVPLEPYEKKLIINQKEK